MLRFLGEERSLVESCKERRIRSTVVGEIVFSSSLFAGVSFRLSLLCSRGFK